MPPGDLVLPGGFYWGGLMGAPSRLTGNLDRLTHSWVGGWVIDPDDPATVVPLELLIDGDPVGVVLANHFRSDLAEAGLRGGRCAFNLRLPHGLSPLRHHYVCLRNHRDGRVLAQARLDRVTAFPAVARALDDMFAALTRSARMPAGLDAPISVLERFAGESPVPAIEPDLRQRALFIDHGPPAAGGDGGSTVAASHMEALERLGYCVTVLATAPHLPALLVPEDGAPAWQPETGDIDPYWAGPPDSVLARLRGAFSVIYVHRLANMLAWAKAVRAANPAAHLVFSVADLESLRLAREAAFNPVEPGLPAARQDEEYEAASSADAVVTHSPVEAALLRARTGTPVHVVRWAAPLRRPAIGFNQRSGVAFIGSFGHAPNRDAAAWLVQAIMPLVWQQNPSLPCLLVGSDPPQVLHDVAAEADGPAGIMTVLGRVPDLSAVWDRVRLTVAPLRFGAGVKVKVVESLANGVPCVCTPVAAEGLEAGLMLQMAAAEPQAVADAILRLHASAVANGAAAEVGQRWVAAAFSAEARDPALAAALDQSASGSRATTAADAPERVSQ